MGKYAMQIVIQLAFTLVMYALSVLFFGISLMPGLALVLKVWNETVQSPLWQKTMCLGFAISAAFFFVWHYVGFTRRDISNGDRTKA